MTTDVGDTTVSGVAKRKRTAKDYKHMYKITPEDVKTDRRTVSNQPWASVYNPQSSSGVSGCA